MQRQITERRAHFLLRRRGKGQSAFRPRTILLRPPRTPGARCPRPRRTNGSPSRVRRQNQGSPPASPHRLSALFTVWRGAVRERPAITSLRLLAVANAGCGGDVARNGDTARKNECATSGRRAPRTDGPLTQFASPRCEKSGSRIGGARTRSRSRERRWRGASKACCSKCASLGRRGRSSPKRLRRHAG